jgi:hypothetical protein
MSKSDESPALKRSGFFDGRLLTPEDFQREQQYVREKLKRHNRTLHGFGIVSGLKVRIDSGRILVESGLALDCEGNELLIETPQSIEPPPVAPSAVPSSAVDWHTAYLNLRLVEDCPTAQSDHAATELPARETERAISSVLMAESVELLIQRENCNRGHRHLQARWLSCGRSHAITIAKLRRRTHGWTVDRGYRPPFVK